MKRIDFDDLGAHLRNEPAHWDTDQAWQRVRARMHRRTPFARLAALLVIGLGVSAIWWQVSNRSTEYRTAVGEHRVVELADGSTVELAPVSVLRVSEFTKAQRTVTLDGEAFFSVKHDEKRTFTVRAMNSETRVLGTSFDVSAYAESHGVEVVVATGRVQLRDARTHQSIVLAPNQAGTLRDGRLTMRDVNAADALSWRGGQLAFRDARFSDVAPVIERWYGVQIVIADPALANARVTAYLPQQSLTEVLDVLAETLNARYQRARHLVTFSLK